MIERIICESITLECFEPLLRNAWRTVRDEERSIEKYYVRIFDNLFALK